MPINTIEQAIPTMVKSGVDDPIVQAATKLQTVAFNIRTEFDNMWQVITDAYIKSFSVTIDNKKFRVNSKLLFQVHRKIVKRLGRPSRKFHTANMSLKNREILRDGVNTVQEKGGLKSLLTSNWGVNHKFILLGDAFIMLGAGSDEIPVTYKSANLLSVYIDPYANVMRSDSGEAMANEALVVFEDSYDAVAKMFPDAKFQDGVLPTINDLEKQVEETDEQYSEATDRKTQFGFYYNLKAKEPVFIVYIGRQGTIAVKLKGKDYPFFLEKDNKEPFIPLVNFKMYPMPSGFYGNGLSLIYDLGVAQEKLRNLALFQVQDNVNPIRILSSAGNAQSFANQMLVAREARAMEETAIIFDQLDSTGGSSNSGNYSQLITAPLTQEYERIQADLTQEIKRCGLPLDEADIPVSQSATATVAETSSITQDVQEIINSNEQAYKDLDLMTMAILRDTVSSENKTPIYTEVKFGDTKVSDVNMEEEGLEQWTIGDIAEILESNDVTVEIDTSSGVLKTPIEDLNNVGQAIELTQGTKMAPKFLAKALRMRGFNIAEEDIAGLEATESPETPQPTTGGNTPQALGKILNQ